jgi:hypothetical protein
MQRSERQKAPARGLKSRQPGPRPGRREPRRTRYASSARRSAPSLAGGARGSQRDSAAGVTAPARAQSVANDDSACGEGARAAGA